MNVLEYAVHHQDATRRILAGVYGVPPDDVEDVAQDAILRVLQAPRHMDYPEAYWKATLRSAAMTYWQRRKIMVPLTIDPADPHQDLETLVIQRERLREALAAVKLSEREAISDYVLGVHKSNRSRVAMHRLRRRLRAT